MPPSSVAAEDPPASWWRRLLAAERRALCPELAADERGVWVAPADATRTAPVSGMLDLLIDGPRGIAGDLRAEAGGWPLRDDSVDHVMLQHAFEVSEDRDALLDEALRVLKPERDIQLLVIGAWSWTRCRLQFRDSGAPPMFVPSSQHLLDGLSQRGCAELRVSRIEFDGAATAVVGAPPRFWSGVCLIQARKRHELPNVRRLGARSRVIDAQPGWVAHPTSRTGLAA